MNIQKLMISAALVAVTTATAGAAMAEARYPVDAPFVSTKTRAEVVAQLTQAGDQGRLNYANSAYPVLQTPVSTKTRAEVKQELAIAEASGELDNIRHNGGN
ncbi:DUF4148 domain-containing protein [Glaciimonas sp. PCH181]|uniref:DUF4148 domain-containing protein n=1 Tax=Glaciimonas sp. PCH181 TaxID=2133943 RepID=UPI000D382EEE|nr:DUF4148 domain-containing protein [Glaciimonas sp. PCH181]PUA17809.1 DUF4148 domain-containing protein [Glaciimonas sp. PCH181]